MTVHFENIENAGAAEITPAVVASDLPNGFYRRHGKRALDLFLIVIASPILVVLFTIIMVVLALSGQKPFYSQERIGFGGTRFRMLKFQTMVPNADVLLKEYLDRNAEARAEWETCQKLKHDPRVTRIGRFLRKSSLDELPQLLNVVAGDMSLVGPRPMMVDQESIYGGSAYYRLRPGLTGPWQVTERNSCAFNARAKHDTLYEATVSFSRDIVLLLATIRVVLRGTGC